VISIDVELLTGRYVASRYDERARAEWPPEPARLFSACVATLHEHPDLGENVRAALEWLERLGPPLVVASKAGRRSVSHVYVPVNDSHVVTGWEKSFDAVRAAEQEIRGAEDEKSRKRAEKELTKAEKRLAKAAGRSTQDHGKRGKEPVKVLPESRARQPRTFPSVRPVVPRVSFIWPDAKPDGEVELSLSDLLSRVVRLGHSSSLVACRLGNGAAAEERPDDTWFPDRDGTVTFRVVTAGQVERLETAFARHRGVEPRVLPSTFQPYRWGPRTERPVDPPTTVFDSDWIVFRAIPGPDRARPPRLLLTRGPDVARALRRALLRNAQDPAPTALSGHAPDGRPLEEPHVAFVALADVGSEWSSGAILGTALVLPRGLDRRERRAILAAVGRFEATGENGRCDLWMGRAGALSLERVLDLDPRQTLRATTWLGPSRRWASVSAVALDRNPGDLRSDDPDKATKAAESAEAIVRTACTRIGLPEPEWAQVMRRSLFDAAPKAESFMPFPRRPNATRRVCVHVELRFAQEVEGPVLLGAGRYVGLGLCRPVREDASWA